MSLVETFMEGPIGTLVMTHPERRNALGAAFIEAFIGGLRTLQRAKARVLVLRAQEGASTWSAGHDIHELDGGDPLTPDQPLPRLLYEVEAFPAPILAMLDGGVFGGAVELALCCDLRTGSQRATFTMPPARLALPYSAEGLGRFIRVVGLATTQELFFTARTVDAERALRLGLMNHLLPDADLGTFTYDLAAAIAENSPRCIQALKASFRLLSHSIPTESLEGIETLRQQVFESGHFREGLEAFRMKRQPVFGED